MICIACILIILAFMPVGYYFTGPVSILLGSTLIFYVGYKRTCSDNQCNGGRR